MARGRTVTIDRFPPEECRLLRGSQFSLARPVTSASSRTETVWRVRRTNVTAAVSVYTSHGRSFTPVGVTEWHSTCSLIVLFDRARRARDRGRENDMRVALGFFVLAVACAAPAWAQYGERTHRHDEHVPLRVPHRQSSTAAWNAGLAIDRTSTSTTTERARHQPRA